MTKQEIFKAAHKLAKTLQGNYSARLSYALKTIYRSIKMWMELPEACKQDNKVKGEDVDAILSACKSGAVVYFSSLAAETRKPLILAIRELGVAKQAMLDGMQAITTTCGIVIKMTSKKPSTGNWIEVA
jgi:hypothetical protein